ncbi:hypothetical protein O181_003504 [Austropuccinia psidii MF-1]|uniref:Uncharacterized protein n=1 Tax=Austropuccinia psidii MF-1 TaxID=1389203 RepID=A0A9Q3BEH4_9BASI|nr:hypothetical protein [Austropuccinia psidii MF-1]
MPVREFPEEEIQAEYSESESMGDSIRENSDYYQDPIEEFVVEYQEETQLEVQDIKQEAGLPQATAKKRSCKHTQYSQTFLLTPIKGMVYIDKTATKTAVCVDNSQQPFIIDSGANFLTVCR